MLVKTEASKPFTSTRQKTEATYEIGTRKAIVTRVFQDDGGQTLKGILVKLLKNEAKKNN